MNNILLIGESYCGKSHFCKELEFLGYEIISVGEVCRKQGFTVTNIPTKEDLLKIIKEELRKVCGPYVIDNPFKTEESANYILEDLCKSEHFIAIEIDNKRTLDLDFSGRGRSDDSNVKAKIKLYRENIYGIYDQLKLFKIPIKHISNTDYGFVI